MVERNYNYITPDELYEANKAKGFWGNNDHKDPRLLGNKIMLVITELSEAIECLRNGTAYDPSDKIPSFTNIEEELADAIIRIKDVAAAAFREQNRTVDLWGAENDKVEYNAERPFMHGKAF